MKNKAGPATDLAVLAAALYAVNIPLSKLLLQRVDATMMAALLYLGAGAGIEAEVTGIGEIKVVHSSQIESVGQTSVESEVGLEEVGASEIMLVGDLASPAETATYSLTLGRSGGGESEYRKNDYDQSFHDN